MIDLLYDAAPYIGRFQGAVFVIKIGGEILLSPDFPGWLAPVTADPVRLSTTVGFAGSWALAWVSAGLVLGAFGTGPGDEGRVGPRGAAAAFATAAAGWTAVAAAAALLLPDAPPALALSASNGEAALGIGVVLLAWRQLYADSGWGRF